MAGATLYVIVNESPGERRTVPAARGTLVEITALAPCLEWLIALIVPPAITARS